MNTNDIVLLIILTIGVVWMNWSTIKGDLFRNSRATPTLPSSNRTPNVRPVSPREKQKEVV